MKNLLKLTAATAALALGVSGANAAFLLGEDIHGEKKVVNTETGENFSVLEPGAGQTLENCPEGTFFIAPDPTDSGAQIATDCTTGDVYNLQTGEDTFRTYGLNYPEGTFFLNPEEYSTGTKVMTEEELEQKRQRF